MTGKAQSAVVKQAAWPARLFVRWSLTWLAVYMAAQFAGVLLSYAWLWSEGKIYFSGDPTLLQLVTKIFPILVFYLVEGVISVIILWVFGRRRRPRRFRVLSLLVFFPLWVPLHIVSLSSMYLDPTWLAASLAVAMLIRQPESALYGPRVSPWRTRFRKARGARPRGSAR
ncbi:hypothetical protein QLQ12_19050 [Actinoplanes sp. NEAU-A12]|uniref:Uncharacterized protein n=1 Tax=Actinoplanes sandaracinus TaxID=3045177 RepID=A0ABT6WLZ0_9ACTN|nr:hypothetical protein [Actinoplanes sandaracinus]MDI6100711.1 hypothetical protein [Actinoplanes sandaracinus]